jgi:regulator of PEP synthase PpsR (kinase-PPPase family)
MSAKYPLTGYGVMAKKHWTEFCPRLVKQLEAQGKLEEALYEAQETTLDEMEALISKLEKEQHLTPQQAHNEAWELIREKYILLPPEEDQND